MEKQNWVSRRTSVLEELSCLLWGSALFGSPLTGHLKHDPLGKFSDADLCQLFACLRDGTYLSEHSHLQTAILKSLIAAMTVATYSHLQKIQNNQNNQIDSWLKRRTAAVKEEIRLCSQKKSWGKSYTVNSLLSPSAGDICQYSHRERSQALQNLKQQIESALYVNTLPLKVRHDFKQDWLPLLSLFLAHRLRTKAKIRECLLRITRRFNLRRSDENLWPQAPSAVRQLIHLFAHPQNCFSLVQTIDFDYHILKEKMWTSLHQASANTVAKKESRQTTSERSPQGKNATVESSQRLPATNPSLIPNSANEAKGVDETPPPKTPPKPATPLRKNLAISATSQKADPGSNLKGSSLTWKCIHTLTGHSDSVVSVAYGFGNSEIHTLATGSWDKTIQIWAINPNLAQPFPIRTLTAHSASVYSVALSPDGQTLASGGVDCTIKLWYVGRTEHPNTGASLMRTLTSHTFPVYSVAFSPDGKLLASGSGDYTIKIWNLETGELLCTLMDHSSFVYSVAFSPDGKTLASGSADKSIKLWQVSNGKLLTTLISYASVNCVAFSPDRQFLVSAGGDERIKLWQLSTSRLGSDTRLAPTQTLRGHTGEIYSLAFSPRSPILASSSYDKTIKLWNVQTGSLLSTLTGHLHSVHSIAFSSDAMHLFSVSHDKTIKIWKFFSHPKTS